MLRRSFFVLLSFFLAGGLCHGEIKANNHPFELGTMPSFKAGPDGLYLGYYSKSEDNALYVKRLDRSPDKETAITFKDMKGQYVDLSFLKDGMTLTWRAKKGDGKKYVYVQRSEDKGNTFKDPVVINSTTDALLPMTTATDGQERLYVVWLDERNKTHGLYMNYSVDGGRSFLKDDVLLTPGFTGANLPHLLLKDNRIDLFFLGSKPGSENGICHRSSDDGGKTWSEVGVIQANLQWSPSSLVSVRSGNRILVFWAGVEGLYGSFTDDGKKWSAIEFKDSAGKDVYKVQIAAAGENAYLVTNWQTRFATDEKPSVYFYKSPDKGTTWSMPRKLNTNEFNSTSSVFPAMGVSDDGKTILAAWQDHRDIRGSIYINYSKDGGDTWLKEDEPIEKEPGKYNSSYPMIEYYGGRFSVLWFRFVNDMRETADLYMKEISIK